MFTGTQTGTTEASRAGPPRPTGDLLPRGGGRPRWSTREERGVAAEWVLRERQKGRRQFDIARELGVSQSTVSDLVTQALSERKGLAVDQLRQVRGEQLENLLEVLTPHLMRTARDSLTGEMHSAPDLDVVDRVLRVTTELAKLEGSVAPTRVNIARTDVDAKIEELAEELASRARGASSPAEP